MFEHTTLSATEQQIRLVRFPALIQPEDGISMIVEHHTFDTAPPYTALSYTWGPELPTQPILLNGQTFLVRQNLWEFLRIARVGRVEVLGEPRQVLPTYEPEVPTTRTLDVGTVCDVVKRQNLRTGRVLFEYTSAALSQRWLWIDQLCINQSSHDQEKNHQVQMMGSIYRKAKLVVAWLGAADTDSECAKEMLLQYRPDTYPYDYKPEIQTGTEKFLRRAYWTRLWVVQELLLARNKHFLCGTFVYDWIYRNDFRHFEGDWGRSFLLPMEMYAAHAPDPLHTIIERFHDVHCSWRCESPHDAVYSLMSLASSTDRLETDYSKPREVVLMEVLGLAMPYYAREIVQNPSKTTGSYKTETVCLAARRTAERTCRALRIPWPKELSLRKVWEKYLTEYKIDEDKFFQARYWRIHGD